jgi:hypothetical protein
MQLVKKNCEQRFELHPVMVPHYLCIPWTDAATVHIGESME